MSGLALSGLALSGLALSSLADAPDPVDHHAL
jgi:hypothetical protein